METDTDQTSEAPVSEVTPDVVASPNDSSNETSAPEVEAPQAPAYVPDYKLKVYDQDAVLEDKFLKDLIKDADSEKKVKEIAQKYLGFDTVKAKNMKVTQEYQTYHQQTMPVVDYYNKASSFLQKNDMDGFFEFLKIPQDVIFKYAVQKAEEAQLAPDQRQFLQQQRQIYKDKISLEEQNQSLQSNQQTQANEYRKQELGWVMARPDVSTTAQAYDAKVGQPGAFRQLVINQGLAYHAATQGKGDLSAEQATMEVLKYIGVFLPQQGQAPTTPLIQQNGAPPIIPNVTGRGTSPVKKQVRSIADLKKKAEELGRSS